jgi:formate hydrogenlyase subunit 6/NADH:ubiquinone oxidoreductase subunit I
VAAISGDRRQRHIINKKRCTDCGVCGRICHHGAIADNRGGICEPKSKLQWKQPEIDTRFCSACGICVSICRTGALRIAPPARKGDIHVAAELYAPAKCVGCALCSRECPLGLIAMKGRGEA